MSINPKRHELQSQKYRIAHGLERSMRPRRILPERHLFVSEGTKTEPNYLYGMIDRVCQCVGENARQQLCVIGDGSCTLNLLKRAEEYQKNDSDGFQHVWIIYDKDDFPADAFDNTVNRCVALNKRYAEENRDLQFHAIWSNQCIELWFPLHYVYLQSDISREEYREKLSEHIERRYEKNDDHIYQTLSSHLDDAIKHSKNLMGSFPSDLPPSQKAPCTNFFELIEHIKSYI